MARKPRKRRRPTRRRLSRAHRAAISRGLKRYRLKEARRRKAISAGLKRYRELRRQLERAEAEDYLLPNLGHSSFDLVNSRHAPEIERRFAGHGERQVAATINIIHEGPTGTMEGMTERTVVIVFDSGEDVEDFWRNYHTELRAQFKQETSDPGEAYFTRAVGWATARRGL